MAASVLKQDPHTRRVKKNAIDCDKIQHANFRGNPLYQATHKKINKKKSNKQQQQQQQKTLKQQLNREN